MINMKLLCLLLLSVLIYQNCAAYPVEENEISEDILVGNGTVIENWYDFYNHTDSNESYPEDIHRFGKGKDRSFKDKVKDKIKDVKDKIKDKIKTVKDKIGDGIDKVKGKLKDWKDKVGGGGGTGGGGGGGGGNYRPYDRDEYRPYDRDYDRRNKRDRYISGGGSGGGGSGANVSGTTVLLIVFGIIFGTAIITGIIYYIAK